MCRSSYKTTDNSSSKPTLTEHCNLMITMSTFLLQNKITKMKVKTRYYSPKIKRNYFMAEFIIFFIFLKVTHAPSGSHS